MTEIKKAKCCGTCVFFSYQTNCDWQVPRGMCAKGKRNESIPRKEKEEFADVVNTDLCKEHEGKTND